jgi:hypothetical protein
VSAEAPMIGTGSATGIATMAGGHAAVTNRGKRYHCSDRRQARRNPNGASPSFLKPLVAVYVRASLTKPTAPRLGSNTPLTSGVFRLAGLVRA